MVTCRHPIHNPPTVTMSRIHIVGDGDAVVCLIRWGATVGRRLMNKTSPSSHLRLHQMKLPIQECA
jgi:hypothetical protein